MKRKYKVIINSIILVLPLLITTSVTAQDIKVACVGNSITEGLNTITFPTQLDGILGPGWDAENFGVSGRTLLKQGDYPYWNETKFTDALNFLPDKVIIMLGTNDSKPYNWVYGNQFYGDYISLVDTFANLASHPEIWVCYPPKAFSGAYDINDSVIYNGIIPQIDSVVAHRNVKLIDLYTLTEDKPKNTYDGIHPTSEGNFYLAKILYENLTDTTIQEVSDTNVVLNKSLTSDNANPDTLAFLNDGDLGTAWIHTGLPASVTIDLGRDVDVDNFELLFASDVNKGYQYTIESSSNSTNWTMMADESTRKDTVHYYSVDTIAPTTMHYIRLTITSFSNSSSKKVIIPEFKALMSTGFKHAPLIYTVRASSSLVFVYWVPLYEGNAIKVSETIDNGKNYTMLGFTANTTGVGNTRVYGSIGNKFGFSVVNFYPGTQVNSDLTHYTFNELINTSGLKQTENQSLQIYPNPFSSEVVFSDLPENSGNVLLKIYDTYGRLVNIIKPIAGSRETRWNGTDRKGNKLPSGIYYCILENDHSILGHKSVVFKNN